MVFLTKIISKFVLMNLHAFSDWPSIEAFSIHHCLHCCFLCHCCNVWRFFAGVSV